MEGTDAVPETIGIVGVGTIGSALVRGLLSSPPGEALAPRKVVLSPRNAERAARLAAEFPEQIRVAGSNQEVVDAADCVVLSVLPALAPAVLQELSFRPGQKLLSLVAFGLPLARLQDLASPVTEVTVAMPLPAVARREGATLMTPNRSWARAIFESVGTCVATDDEERFRRMQCLTGLMGDLYKRQLTTQRWLESHGVPQEEAASWVGASFATMMADSSTLSPDTLEKLVAEQTPNGLNEMAWKEQEAAGAYEALTQTMDSLHHRITVGKANPALAPKRIVASNACRGPAPSWRRWNLAGSVTLILALTFCSFAGSTRPSATVRTRSVQRALPAQGPRALLTPLLRR